MNAATKQLVELYVGIARKHLCEIGRVKNSQLRRFAEKVLPRQLLAMAAAASKNAAKTCPMGSTRRSIGDERAVERRLGRPRCGSSFRYL
jgi:hypothetical protein